MRPTLSDFPHLCYPHELLQTEALVNLFKLFKDRVECVLLNACYSEEQAKAIVKHIPFVIGMSDAIDDRVAIEFASAFYDALGAGKDVKFAYKIGINAIEIGGSTQADIPKLHCKDIIHKKNHNNYSKRTMQLTSKFSSSLNSMSIEFIHRNKENITFDDLFIFPPLRKMEVSLSKENSLILKEEIWEHNDRIIIFGEEQSGKTSLSKHLFSEAHRKGYFPLLFNGEEISNSNVEELIKKRVKYIYSNKSFISFDGQVTKICIIDDFSSCRLTNNPKALKNLIESLHLNFQKIILIAQDSFNFITPDFPILSEYKKIEILPFGHEHRSHLIEKWMDLGSEETETALEIFKKKDNLTLHINSLVLKNVVPAKPFFILLLLQSFEIAKPQGQELSSQGHCYQYLIYQSLERAGIKQNDFDTYINFLTELGGTVMENSSGVLDKTSQDEFFRRYTDKYLISEPMKKLIDDLINSSILIKVDTGIKFKYRYLFYFFAAKKLADSLHKGEVAKSKIRELVETIHLEQSSNIILFLTHHSRNEWIIEEITNSVNQIFSSEIEATLEAESLLFFKGFLEKIPAVVLEQREAREERLQQDRRQDIAEQNYQDINEDELEIDIDPNSLMSKINKMFRSIDVCGQILRSRIGSLERNSLESIVNESFSVSMRFIGLALKISENLKEESLKEIKNLLEQHPTVPHYKLTQQAQKIYWELNYWLIIGVLHKVAFCTGSVKGREIYIKIADKLNSPSARLIQGRSSWG
jgi:hypothetical protein